MFLVWGSTGYLKELGETDIQQTCPHCNNDVTLVGKKVGRKFTMFWIQLFPFSSKYYVVCPICESGVQTDKEELQEHLIEEA